MVCLEVVVSSQAQAQAQAKERDYIKHVRIKKS